MCPTSPRRLARTGLALAGALALTITGCAPDSQPTAPRAVSPPRLTVGTTLTVTNTDDAGPGSLRQAILDADDGAIIHFDASIAGGTIALTGGPPLIGKALTIEGPASSGMTITRGSANRVFQVLAAGDVTLRNLTITGGDAGDATGGAITSNGQLTLDHSTISGSHARGGAAILSNGTLQLLNSTISGNQADEHGGGVYAAIGTLTVTNSTISGNEAGDEGGGIYVDEQAALTMTSSTVAYNTAADGGGFFSWGDPPVIQNTIIANNTAGAGGVTNCGLGGESDPATFLGTNLSNDLGCGAAGPTMILADPNLGPLADNGGSTKTHALLAGSPAIDAATDCTVSDDQRDVGRPQGTACDIGAYELIRVRIAIDPSGTVNSKTGVAVVSGTTACTGQWPLTLRVTMRQSRKVGKVNTVVQASGDVAVDCGALRAWAIALTPATGAFGNSPATVSAETVNAPKVVIPASTSATVKLAWSRR